MIEYPPKINDDAYLKYIMGSVDESIYPIINQINDDYEYWDKVKYKNHLPKGVSPKILWTYVKASRQQDRLNVWNKYGIKLFVTNKMQRLCHDFDMKFGSFWEADNNSQSSEKKYYLSSSLMEEAIYSSKMEGASTTRIVAKEMLRNAAEQGVGQIL